MKYLLIIALLFGSLTAYAATCDDPKADNYQKEGVCEYPANGMPLCMQEATCKCFGLTGVFKTACERQNALQTNETAEVIPMPIPQTEEAILGQIQALQEQVIVLLNQLLVLLVAELGINF